MYETMSEIIRANNIHDAILVVSFITAMISVILGGAAMAMMANKEDDKTIEGALLYLVVFVAIFVSAVISIQFYPNDKEAVAMMEALAASKGMDAAPYIKIIENEN